MKLAIAYGASKQEVGKFPELVLRNCNIVKAPSGQENPLAVLARPGLTDFGVVGAGPIRGVARKAGLFGNDALLLSGNTLYRVASTGVSTAFTGSVAGRDRVKIDIGRDADDNDVARIATGDAMYKAQAGAVAAEDFPAAAGAGAQDLVFHRGFWIAIETGTDKAYYQIPGETTWNALDFASAEYQPDKLVAVDTIRDQIWLFGDVTTEVFTLTGADPAIAPYGGLAFDVGCRARDTVVSQGGSVTWVDDRCNVQTSSGGEPVQIADAGLSGVIREAEAEDLRAWGFGLDARSQYVLSLGSSTWAYDRSIPTWATWDSKGYDHFRGHLGCEYAGQIIAVDANQGSGQIWLIDPDAMDDDGDEFATEFSAYLELKEGRANIGVVELIGLTGDAPMTGQGSAPLVSMRYSTDGCKSWSSWRHASMGTTGDYAGRVRWRQLGQAKAPHGMIFQFRCSEPIGRRFSDLRVNAR